MCRVEPLTVRRLRTTAARLLLALSVTVSAAALMAEVARAEAGDGISATGATVDKVGWWHSSNMTTSTPAANVTLPPPPGVPAGTLAVGALNGEPDRLAAVGILPEAAAGDSITAFTMTIKESGPPAAGFNGAAAKISACPITTFWVGGENGAWDTRPTYDCELAKAAGTRSEDGTWTFDLQSIGAAWLDPAGTIAPDGIVLVEEVDSPEGFQTVFATSGEGALVVTLEVAPSAGTDGGEPVAPVDGSGSFDGGSFDGGSPSFETPAIGSGDIPVGGLPAPEVESPAAGTTPQDAAPSVSAPIASAGPDILGNLPGGLVLLVPAFLVLLGLLSYSLGPAGEPSAAARQRGVSRVLAARERDLAATASSHPVLHPSETS